VCVIQCLSVKSNLATQQSPPNWYLAYSLNAPQVSRVGTAAAFALWYNTARVSILTHGNVNDASYAISPILVSLSLLSCHPTNHTLNFEFGWMGAVWRGLGGWVRYQFNGRQDMGIWTRLDWRQDLGSFASRQVAFLSLTYRTHFDIATTGLSFSSIYPYLSLTT
jgi:hypothetical protein